MADETTQTIVVPPPTPEQMLFNEWKASVSTKQFVWFVGKASAGIAAAPYVMTALAGMGLTLAPGSFLEKTIPSILPAILGGLLHAGQDWTSFKTSWKWI